MKNLYTKLLAVLILVVGTCTPCVADSSKTQRSSGGGFSLGHSWNTVSPGMFTAFSYGRYRLEGPYINLTMVGEDPYNNGSFNVSALGLINMLALSVVGLVHPDDMGGTASTVINGIVFVPSVLLNGQHHLKLGEVRLSQRGHAVGLSAFAGTHTDYFPKWKKNRTDWFRHSHGLGAEIRLLGPRATSTGKRSALALQVGVNWSYDFVVSGPTRSYGERVFVGLKYSWDALESAGR